MPEFSLSLIPAALGPLFLGGNTWTLRAAIPYILELSPHTYQFLLTPRNTMYHFCLAYTCRGIHAA